MLTTILAAVALSGSLAPAAKPEFPVQSDYAKALTQAANEKKPMAVLIGKGDLFAKLSTDLTAEAKKTLADKYVCVAIDADSKSGAELADQFQLTNGLVISSAGGTYQALRHSGTVKAADLAKHATAYATATGVPATTASTSSSVITSTSFYRGAADTTPAGAAAPASHGTVIVGGCVGGNCGTPVIVSGGCASGNCGTPVYYGRSFSSTPYYSISGSSCPNGRCPTPR